MRGALTLRCHETAGIKRVGKKKKLGNVGKIGARSRGAGRECQIMENWRNNREGQKIAIGGVSFPARQQVKKKEKKRQMPKAPSAYAKERSEDKMGTSSGGGKSKEEQAEMRTSRL